MTVRLSARWLPPRRPEAHKGNFGHVMVVAGSRGYMGAACLAAAGALRAGAGLVTVAHPAEETLPSPPWEAMTLPLPSRGGAIAPAATSLLLAQARRRRATAWVIGPGIGVADGTRKWVGELLRRSHGVRVLDADGLNVLAGRRFSTGGEPLVLTPHPGELARWQGAPVGNSGAERSAAARRAARRAGGVCVLKGRGTVVTDGRRAWVNTTGRPGMASGGMGDVLSGVIAALAGQVSGAGPVEKSFRAAILGVYVHGRAADLAARARGVRLVTAGDVVDFLPRALRFL
jgi:NAD(P)H-hydrate epimerase